MPAEILSNHQNAGFWSLTRKSASLLKLGMDFSIALLLLVLTSPLLAFAALLVKLGSPGPVIYSQTRLGRGGKPYRIFKLRTMIHNCEKNSGARWSTPGDSRITSIGRLLRRTHIDELPQLWNVLRGDMSLVGPRPERPEFAVHLDQVISYYRKRLAVRPGVTGLAQVQLPGDTDLESVRRKLAYDLYYIQRYNPWLDLKIMLCTGFKMLGASFVGLRRFFRLPVHEQVEAAYERLLLEGPRVPLTSVERPSWKRVPVAAEHI
jgi:lipopolysaccharide/colanic/teichoic acid biosynthesis glycosyltransferase